jgi:hypothetical protein
VRRTLLVALLFIALPDRALAQEATAASRPDERVVTSGRALDMSAWIGTGYDGRFTRGPESSAGIDPSLEADGAHGQAGVALSFARVGDRLSLNTGVQSGFRADAATAELWTTDYQATFGMGLSLTRRTRVETRHLAKYAAINPLAVVGRTLTEEGADLIQPGADRPFAVRQALTSASDTSMRHDISRRTSIVLTHTYAYTAKGIAEVALHQQSAGGRLERRLTPHLKGRLGYRMVDTTYDKVTGSMLKMHDLDAGFEFQRPLPFSRRSSIKFDTGSSILQDRTRRVFRVLGGVSVSYPLARWWEARVSFSRPVQMLEGMPAPLVSTAATAAVAGSIGRRHNIVAMVDRFVGTMSLDASNATFADGYSTSVRWRTALSRRIALNVEGFHGRVRFGSDVAMLTGVAPDSAHLGVRAFVSFWRPLFRD